jgi:hypothetical protein
MSAAELASSWPFSLKSTASTPRESGADARYPLETTAFCECEWVMPLGLWIRRVLVRAQEGNLKRDVGLGSHRVSLFAYPCVSYCVSYWPRL